MRAGESVLVFVPIVHVQDVKRRNAIRLSIGLKEHRLLTV